MTATSTWLAELLAVGAALAAGSGAFLLARALYPATFAGAVQRRRSALMTRPGLAGPGRLSRSRRMLLLAAAYPRLLADAFMESLSNFAEPFVREAWATRMKRKFTAMGRPELRPQDFRARQLLYAGILALFGLLLFSALGKAWIARIAATALLGLAGFFLPYVWLRDQIAKRQRDISRALPYHLDLMTLSLEAGLDFAQGMATVVERGRPGALLEELNIVVSEMKLGKTREEALRALAERVQTTEVTSFVSTLIQADKMGTSLGKVLRIQSGQMRVMRAQQAEKAANEAPVKMLVPLVLCFFPTMFIILFGPIVYRMMLGG